MKKCSKCYNEMIKTKRKVRPVLIHIGIDFAILMVLSFISLEYNITGNWVITILDIIVSLNLLLNFISLIVDDAIVRYECQKCGYSKQRISIIDILIEILTEL